MSWMSHLSGFSTEAARRGATRFASKDSALIACTPDGTPVATWPMDSAQQATAAAQLLNEHATVPRPVPAPPPATPTQHDPLLEWIVSWTDSGGQHRRFTTHAPDIEIAAWAAARSVGTLRTVSEGRITAISLAAGQAAKERKETPKCQ